MKFPFTCKIRDGRTAHVLGRNPTSDIDYPLVGYIEGEDESMSWTEAGKYLLEENYHKNFDLILPITLKPLTYYWTRSGDQVLLSNRKDDDGWIGMIFYKDGIYPQVCVWKDTGEYVYGRTDLDIIAEVKED